VWKILEDFGKLSSLDCNVEKEQFVLKQCSTGIHRRNWFFCSRICNYQDLQIYGDTGSFNNSCEKICTKVRNNILVCKQFNLSLSGWICIAKTMLYRQLNYFQYFIDIPQSFLKPISDMISTYICGYLNLASNRLYLPAYMGGLGLFEIETFLAAQKRSWIQCS